MFLEHQSGSYQNMSSFHPILQSHTLNEFTTHSVTHWRQRVVSRANGSFSFLSCSSFTSNKYFLSNAAMHSTSAADLSASAFILADDVDDALDNLECALERFSP